MQFSEEHLANLRSKQTQDKRAQTIYKNSLKLVRTCTVCGLEFTPTHHNQKICKRQHTFPCPICGKPVAYINNNKNRCCSKQCTQKKREQTNLKKFGCAHAAENEDIKNKIIKTNQQKYGHNSGFCTEQVQEKYKSTCIRKYGVSNPQKCEDIRNKTQQTCMEKYGVPCVLQADSVREKAKRTCLLKYGEEIATKSQYVKDKTRKHLMEKYGVVSTAKLESVKQKAKQTRMLHYGTLNPWKVPEIRNKVTSTMIARYGVPWYVMTDECKRVNGRVISSVNKKFAQFLQENSIEYSMEFALENKSYDFKVGNTLIEINPTASHNSYINFFSNTLISHYDIYTHRNKTDIAMNHGYRCIHVFDWNDWNDMLDLFTASSDVLYARDCKVVELIVDNICAHQQANHIQGSCTGQKICIGLIYKDSIVMSMSFGKPRYNTHYDWELLRLCTSKNTRVVGGTSKLYSYAVNKYGLHNVISYCDISKFSGTVYSKLGFTLNTRTAPSKIWSKKNMYITDNLLRQKGFDNLFNTSYGKGTSNEELMIQNKWLPVYDCGQLVFVDRR